MAETSDENNKGDENGREDSETAPDGGYGWVVVAAAFAVHFICDGVGFSFGVMYPTIQDLFQTGKGTSAWVGSLFFAIPSLAAPLASFVIDRYGYRFATVLGGVVAPVGMMLSVFAPSLWMLCITFGLISGFGLCLSFAGAIVAVTMYFDKRRALATGLTVSGTGIGTFMMAPVVEWLIRQYEYSGCLLILSAFMLNLIICGLLIRDLPSTEKSAPAPSRVTMNADTALPPVHDRHRSSSDSQLLVSTENSSTFDNIDSALLHRSMYCVTDDARTTDRLRRRSRDENVLPATPSMLAFADFRRRQSAQLAPSVSADQHPQDDPTPTTALSLVTSSFGFLLFVVNSLLLYIFVDIPYVNLPEFAVSRWGISDRDASLLVSIIGIVNIPGMILFGVLADLPFVNKNLLYGSSCVLCGASVLWFPWASNYFALATACALFGVSVSANYTLSSVLIAHLMPITNFTGGYGIISFAEGVGTLVGPAVAGYLYDLTGSYLSTFVVGGVGIVISGLLMFVIECHTKTQSSTSQQRNVSLS